MTRLLIVDDEDHYRRSLSLALGAAGFDTLTASCAEEALDTLSAHAVDIALVDLMMPGTSGLDLARTMQTSYPDVRVVLLSAYHLSGRQVERANCGAVGFVPKPYRVEELAEFLRGKACAPPSRPSP